MNIRSLTLNSSCDIRSTTSNIFLTAGLISDVYSFEEEEAVLDPHISEHLSHFGIDMLQMQKRVRNVVFFNLSIKTFG